MPSGSDEPDPIRVTSSGALPVVGVAAISAVGDALAAGPTWMTFWAVPTAFLLSFTVSFAVYAPLVV